MARRGFEFRADFVHRARPGFEGRVAAVDAFVVDGGDGGRIGRSGQGSFLAVFKTFGDRRSPGLLSFPRPGATLALDFPNRGADTLKLFTELDAVVSESGGALYPAKDARMSPDLFLSGYPRLHEFTRYLDPAFSSSFWRRAGPPSSAARSADTPRADAVRADSSTTSASLDDASPADAPRGHAPSAAA